MKSAEMVTLFTQACSKKYETVSPPLNAEGENPIFLAVSKKSLTQQHRQFHLYEIVDQETFLKNPGKISSSFNDKNFMMSAFRHVDAAIIKENGEHLDVKLRKLIPSSAGCVMQIKTMLDAAPKSAEGIFFLSADGDIFDFEDLLREFASSGMASRPLSRAERRAQRPRH